jgi:hypothetical protein
MIKSLVQETDPAPATWRRSPLWGVPLNDNTPAGGRCPACGAYAPLRPSSVEYRGDGLIHHRWSCQPCGHQWVTVLRVYAS